MSSLRPDTGRDGHSGRSRSRSRTQDRDASPDLKKSSSKREKEKRKEKRHSRYESPEELEISIPGAFEQEPNVVAPKYEVREARKPSKAAVMPGLSSLAAGLPPLSSRREVESDEQESSEEQEESNHDRRKNRNSQIYEGIPQPPTRGMTMPSMSSKGDFDSRNFPPPTRRKTGGPAYPLDDDDSAPFVVMPNADYDVLNDHLAYGSPPEDVKRKIEIRKPPSRRSTIDSTPKFRGAPNPKYGSSPPIFEPTSHSSTLPHVPEVREVGPRRAEDNEGRKRSDSNVFDMDDTPDRQSQIKRENEKDSKGRRSRIESTYDNEPQLRQVRPKKPHDEVREGRDRSNSTMLSVNVAAHSIRTPSPGGLHTRMGSLSVGGTSGHGGGMPPPSPLLEAYKGTYQSISPMPSPIMLPADADDDIEPIDMLSKEMSREEIRTPKRRARIYDPESDAQTIYDALNHRRHAETGPLIEVLPKLDHDQIEALRKTYRQTYKYSGAKIDLAKHIKLMTEGNFGKIAFVTASGRWKSEAYWANCWYQSHSAGRELLVESLFGLPNSHIHSIKSAFRDKKYDDDLERCLRKELKPDKFRDAVLLVLSEQRQEETETWGADAVVRDVGALRMALVGATGGESAILKIVCLRSEKHLRDCLRGYEANFKSSFARDALKKSNNLVGEVIAHILNGVINRPERDSLLLHHAIDDISSRNKAVELRYELLMSRLVRVHWDAKNLALVKEAYKRKYKRALEDDIEEATSGDFKRFCLRLCET